MREIEEEVLGVSSDNDDDLAALFEPYRWAVVAATRGFGHRLRLRVQASGERLGIEARRTPDLASERIHIWVREDF